MPSKLTRKYATFKWERERLVRRWRGESMYIAASLRVERARLFNVTAYAPGDFRQFFADPRTREEYLKWAPFLCAAEDYHAAISKGEAVKVGGM